MMGSMSTEVTLGEYLVREGLISQTQFNRALDHQRETSRSIGRILVELGLISESMRMTILQKQLGYDLVRIREQPVDERLLALIPYSFAEKHRVVPIMRSPSGALCVAMEDPSDLLLIDAVKHQIGMKVQPCIASRDDIQRILNQYQTGAEIARRRALPRIEDRLWYRIAKHAAFPVLALAPLVMFFTAIYLDTWGIRDRLQMLFQEKIMTTFDLMLYIGLGWGLWAIILFEINGLIFSRRKTGDGSVV